MDIVEALFAGFHRKGLTPGFNCQPLFDASQEAAFFGGEAGLLPWIGGSGAEPCSESGIDFGLESAGKRFCGDGVHKIVAIADRLRSG